MDTSELLRTPLNVCLITLTLLATFLAAQRIRYKWMRIPVRVACSVGAVLCFLLLAFMLFATGRPDETFTAIQNGPFKALVRSQEFHRSGTINTDVCVAETSSRKFPKANGLQCFLHGFDFSDLQIKWLSAQAIEISFRCGRVSAFQNSAFVYPSGAVPTEFRATLHDECPMIGEKSPFH
jgi:hypothetical protein